MKKNLFFLLIAILTMTNFVFAADWVQIDEKIYMDADSLSLYNYGMSRYDNDGLYSIWIKRLNNGKEYWKNIEKNIGKKLWYSKEFLVVNCTKKEIAIKSFVYYDLKENVADNYDRGYLDWMSVVPETVGELEYNVVCSAVAPNVSNTTSPDQNNIIVTPSGQKLQIKYHKKRTSFFNKQ